MTVEVINVEESAVLVDVENIRLSWEKYYRRVFRYTDLCWLCLLLERHFQTNVGRIVVFMSDPEECKGTIGEEQLNEMRLMYRYLQEDQARSTRPGGNVNEQTKLSKNDEQLTHNAFRAQEICLQELVSPSPKKTSSVECYRSLGANEHYQSNQCNGLLVDLCSDDGDNSDTHDGDERSSCLESKVQSQIPDLRSSSSSPLGDSDTSSDVISVDDDDSDGLCSDTMSSYSVKKPCESALIASRQTPIGDISHEDDVEWIMSVDVCRSGDPQCHVYAQDAVAANSLADPTSECSPLHVSSSSPKPEDSSNQNEQLGEEIEEPFTRLGQDTCPHCQVVVKAFGYKMSGRRRVQRCCDVAIGNEVTKICFMARFSSIFLFSADSDFEDTARSCIETENYGGVIKYAKPIRILGFSFAFESNTAHNAREAFLKRRALRQQSQHTQRNSNVPRKAHGSIDLNTLDSGVSVFFIDYEFPVIRRVLNRSDRPILQQCAMGKTNSSMSNQVKRYRRHGSHQRDTSEPQRVHQTKPASPILPLPVSRDAPACFQEHSGPLPCDSSTALQSESCATQDSQTLMKPSYTTPYNSPGPSDSFLDGNQSYALRNDNSDFTVQSTSHSPPPFPSAVLPCRTHGSSPRNSSFAHQHGRPLYIGSLPSVVTDGASRPFHFPDPHVTSLAVSSTHPCATSSFLERACVESNTPPSRCVNRSRLSRIPHGSLVSQSTTGTSAIRACAPWSAQDSCSIAHRQQHQDSSQSSYHAPSIEATDIPGASLSSPYSSNFHISHHPMTTASSLNVSPPSYFPVPNAPNTIDSVEPTGYLNHQNRCEDDGKGLSNEASVYASCDTVPSHLSEISSEDDETEDSRSLLTRNNKRIPCTPKLVNIYRVKKGGISGSTTLVPFSRRRPSSTFKDLRKTPRTKMIANTTRHTLGRFVWKPKMAKNPRDTQYSVVSNFHHCNDGHRSTVSYRRLKHSMLTSAHQPNDASTLYTAGHPNHVSSLYNTPCHPPTCSSSIPLSLTSTFWV